MSSRSRNVCPQKRGNVFGKQIDASVWLASMSAMRSDLIQQPGRISSNVVGVTSSSENPTAADNFGNGYTRSS